MAATFGPGPTFPDDFESSAPRAYRSPGPDFVTRFFAVASAHASSFVLDEALAPERWVEHYGSLLYRRLLEPEQSASYVAMFEQLSATVSRQEAARRVLLAMMLSPYFVFRIEVASYAPNALVGIPPRQPPGALLDPFSIAARLSHFTLRSGPDAELLAAAADGSLSRPEVLAAQLDRLGSSALTASARARQVLEWLDVDQVRPAWPLNDDLELGAELREQTRRFVSDLLERAQVPYVELLTSSRQPVSARLAELYGISAEVGSDFAWLALDPTFYAGVLSHGSVLSRYNDPSRRGVFVLERLLGQDFPAIPTDHLFDEPDYMGTTPREKVLSVTQLSPCNVCHSRIDPNGFALEAFDGRGRLTGFDSSGELKPLNTSEGIPVRNPGELGRAIAGSDQGRFGAARAYFEQAVDRDAGSDEGDQLLIECLARLDPGELDLRKLARSVATSAALQRVEGERVRISAVSVALDFVERARDEAALLASGMGDPDDRVLLDVYREALRELQLKPTNP